MCTSVLSKPNASPDGKNRARNSDPRVSSSSGRREAPARTLGTGSATATSGRCAASIFPRKAGACNLELGGAPDSSLDMQCGEVFSAIPESMWVILGFFFLKVTESELFLSFTFDY